MILGCNIPQIFCIQILELLPVDWIILFLFQIQNEIHFAVDDFLLIKISDRDSHRNVHFLCCLDMVYCLVVFNNVNHFLEAQMNQLQVLVH